MSRAEQDPSAIPSHDLARAPASLQTWKDAMDGFIASQPRLSKLAARWQHKPESVHQQRITQTFKGAVAASERRPGYCFALTALWLHEAAFGRSEALLQRLQAFCAAGGPLPPSAKRSAHLRTAMYHMRSLNARQRHGEHALDGSKLHKHKLVIAYADAEETLAIMVRNLPEYGFWELSSARHTIGVHLTPETCRVYDPNDAEGELEACRGSREALIAYLAAALQFSDVHGPQPLSLTAFDVKFPASGICTSFAGVTRDNVNARTAGGVSVADITLRFAPAVSALHLLRAFRVEDVGFCLAEATLGCERSPSWLAVLDHLLLQRRDLSAADRQDAMAWLRSRPAILAGLHPVIQQEVRQPPA